MEKEAKEKISQSQILSAIVSEYSDDKEFLKKINKITFGLIYEKGVNYKKNNDQF